MVGGSKVAVDGGELTCTRCSDDLNIYDILCSLLLSEPQSGIPLEVLARFQVNVLIEPSKELSLFKSFKNRIFIPAFWFETRMTLPDKLVFQMWTLSNLPAIFRITGYTMFGLALGALIVIAVYWKVGVIDVKKIGPALVEEDVSTLTIVNNSFVTDESNEVDNDESDVAAILSY